MQFQTPQFIDVEDKIFGPLTFKQFLYLVGWGGISFVIYNSLPFFFAVLLILPIGALSISLAFVKINERPFIDVLEAAFNYAIKSKLYIWKKEKKPLLPQTTTTTDVTQIKAPTLSQSRLRDMAWGLDVHKNIGD